MNDEQELIQAAREAAISAYAPYSRFSVGAALRFADGGGAFLVEGLARARCFYGGKITFTNGRAGQRAVDGAQPERHDERTGQDH